MKLKLTRLVLFAALISSCIAGCDASPNMLIVEKLGIRAQGSISGHREWIELIDVDLRGLSESQAHDLIVGFSSGKQVALSDITEDVIKHIAMPSSRYYSAPSSDHSYVIDGYGFDFAEGKLTHFIVNQYGYPPKRITAFVKIGSQKSGASLSLPCSVDDLEKVFGTATKVTRENYE